MIKNQKFKTLDLTLKQTGVTYQLFFRTEPSKMSQKMDKCRKDIKLYLSDKATNLYKQIKTIEIQKSKFLQNDLEIAFEEYLQMGDDKTKFDKAVNNLYKTYIEYCSLIAKWYAADALNHYSAEQNIENNTTNDEYEKLCNLIDKIVNSGSSHKDIKQAEALINKAQKYNLKDGLYINSNIMNNLEQTLLKPITGHYNDAKNLINSSTCNDRSINKDAIIALDLLYNVISISSTINILHHFTIVTQLYNSEHARDNRCNIENTTLFLKNLCKFYLSKLIISENEDDNVKQKVYSFTNCIKAIAVETIQSINKKK